MIRPISLGVYVALFLIMTECSRGQVFQSSAESSRISLCQVMSHPNAYIGQHVSLRVRVRAFRHGLSISDDACSRYSVSLTSASPRTDSLAAFDRFINEHRQSGKPIFVTVEGRLVKGEDQQFVIRRNFVFNLESVSEMSEGRAMTTP